MSSTGRPRRPPFLLTSSFQICMASSAGLPLAESPPVSAMPKPILIGSAAWATNVPALATTNVPVRAPISAQLRSGRIQSWLIASSLSARLLRNPPVSWRAQDCVSALGLVKRTDLLPGAPASGLLANRPSLEWERGRHNESHLADFTVSRCDMVGRISNPLRRCVDGRQDQHQAQRSISGGGRGRVSGRQRQQDRYEWEGTAVRAVPVRRV